MVITGIEVLAIPDARDVMMVVVVDTDEGLYGIGEVGIRSQLNAVRGALEQLTARLVGQDPSRIEYLWQLQFRGGFFPGDRILSAAISAVDIALWDLRGKTLGVPVHQLLGGRVRDYVTCYTHLREEYDGNALVEAAHEAVEAGWRHLRWCVPEGPDGLLEPRVSMRRAITLFHAVREAVGDDIELLLDVHTRFDPPEALTLCREIEAARPLFVEDPLRSEGPDSYRMFRARTGVPLAAGEQFASKWEFRSLVDGDLIDYCRLDLCIVGGFTEARKIAGWCEAHYINMALHNPLSTVSSAAAFQFNLACSNFGVQEQPLVVPDPSIADVFPVQPHLVGGRLVGGDLPGIGIEIDRVAARRLSAEAGPRPPLPRLHREDRSFTNW